MLTISSSPLLPPKQSPSPPYPQGKYTALVAALLGRHSRCVARLLAAGANIYIIDEPAIPTAVAGSREGREQGGAGTLHAHLECVRLHSMGQTTRDPSTANHKHSDNDNDDDDDDGDCDDTDETKGKDVRAS